MLCAMLCAMQRQRRKKKKEKRKKIELYSTYIHNFTNDFFLLRFDFGAPHFMIVTQKTVGMPGDDEKEQIKSKKSEGAVRCFS